MAFSLALAPGVYSASGGLEAWVTPDLLGAARAEEAVDLQSVCNVATEILFLLSGRRFGIRTETARPGGLIPCYGPMEWPQTLELKGPVQRIITVMVDGEAVSSSEYRLYEDRRLVRTPDSQGNVRAWPVWQRLDIPDTEPETFSVTYQWGALVPEGGKLAAQAFATELAKYLNREASALADRVLTVSRQGITQTLIDPSQFLRECRTGLYLVDAWLGAVNPTGTRRRPLVASPDRKRFWRQST